MSQREPFDAYDFLVLFLIGCVLLSIGSCTVQNVREAMAPIEKECK